MTRRLRPPAPLRVSCADDGTLRSFRYGHRERRVTRIVSAWEAPAAWWNDEDPAQVNPLLLARSCLRLVADDHFVCEVFRVESGQWYIHRILD